MKKINLNFWLGNQNNKRVKEDESKDVIFFSRWTWAIKLQAAIWNKENEGRFEGNEWFT